MKAQRDNLGHIISLTNSQGQTRSFNYDAFGRVAEYKDATDHLFTIKYDSTGRATSMVARSGGLTVVRGEHGRDIARRISPGPHLVLASAKAETPATSSPANSELYDDGWFDPLGAGGLLGAITDDAPVSLASPLQQGVASPDASQPGDGVDPPPPGEGGEGEGEGEGSIGSGPSPICQSCMSTYQATCDNSQDDCTDAAATTAATAALLCTVSIEAPPIYAACLGAALLVQHSADKTCTTNFNNCVSLIPQNCFSQCSGT